MKIYIEHFEKITNTPAVPLAVRGWHEGMQAGLLDWQFYVQWDQRAIVAFDSRDDKAVGVLTWTKTDWNKSAGIHLGYVLPDYRKKDVYNFLWKALVKIARTENLTRIAGSTHLNNKVMRAVAAKQFREEVSVNLLYLL